MKIQKKVTLFLIILLTNFISAQTCEVYDDFSSGILDIDKWEVRQDVEGQPLMDEYGVLNESGNFVFHTKQNTIADRRVYLVPKRKFTTGDVLEYDFNIISKEGNSGQMTLLTGNQYIRVGIMGDIHKELGNWHIKIEFQENNFYLERTKPSGEVLIDNLALTLADGVYELYVGTHTGHNGRAHIDFDNFKICTEEPEPNLEERIEELEERVEELEERTSFLESIIDKIIEFIEDLPKGLSKYWKD